MTEPARSFSGPGVDDETDDATTTSTRREPPVRAANGLDALRAEVEREIENDPVTFSVPGREGWGVRFNANVSGDTIKAWARKCTRKRGGQEDFDPLKFAKIVLANQAETLTLDGEDVWADGDETDLINFSHPALLDMVNASSALEAVKTWYGNDGTIMQLSQQVLEAAGYSDNPIEDVHDEDPTQRS